MFSKAEQELILKNTACSSKKNGNTTTLTLHNSSVVKAPSQEVWELGSIWGFKCLSFIFEGVTGLSPVTKGVKEPKQPHTMEAFPTSTPDLEGLIRG